MTIVNFKQSQKGVSIIEMMLVMVVTAIIFAITQTLLARTIDSWWRVNANADAQQQLYKAQNFIERDLTAAAFENEPSRETLRLEKAPAELVHLAGADGDVFWFLSAINPVSGEFERCPNGQPHWQRNILYYAVTPTDLNTFGYLGAGTNVGGYEVSCPYKVLIRKEINMNPDPLQHEPLMTYDQITPHLNRPVGYNVSTTGAPNVAARPISGNIVTFQVNLEPVSNGVTIDLRATAIERAKREGRIDSRDLANNPASQQLQITVFPPNRQSEKPTDGSDPNC